MLFPLIIVVLITWIGQITKIFLKVNYPNAFKGFSSKAALLFSFFEISLPFRPLPHE